MRLGYDPADEAFRQELVAFIDEHAPAQIRGGRDWIGDDEDTDADGIMVIPEWARRVAGHVVRPRLDDPGLPA